jgi:cell wall-associated NlpC family hydrolase
MTVIKTIIQFAILALALNGSTAVAAINTDYESGAPGLVYAQNPAQNLFKPSATAQKTAAVDSKTLVATLSSQELDQLLNTALTHIAYETVPYVWGGNKIGSPKDCEECSQCIIKYKKRGPSKRHLKCPACQQCGMDCSHFVQKVFKDAGLAFPYASTRSLLKVPSKKPDVIPGLRFISSNLKDAQPGDLLVQKKHVVILINKKSDTVGDIVHMSRTVRSSGRIGGIALKRDANLTRFFGGVKRIFRHEKLINTQPIYTRLNSELFVDNHHQFSVSDDE